MVSKTLHLQINGEHNHVNSILLKFLREHETKICSLHGHYRTANASETYRYMILYFI